MQLASILVGLADLVHLLITLYIYAIIARAVMSWFNPNPYNPFVKFVVQITEPPLEWLRRKLPNFNGIDISPMILILALIVVDRIIRNAFYY